MVPRIITVTTHLSADNPPDQERLRIALEKLITATYGEASTLHLKTGHTDENPDENMLNIKGALNQAIELVLEEGLHELFKMKFVIGYNRDDDDKVLNTRAEAIATAFRKLKKIFESLDVDDAQEK